MALWPHKRPAGGQDLPVPAGLQHAVPLLGHQHLVQHGQAAEPIGGELLLQRDAVDRVNDAPSGVFDVEVVWTEVASLPCPACSGQGGRPGREGWGTEVSREMQ